MRKPFGMRSGEVAESGTARTADRHRPSPCGRLLPAPRLAAARANLSAVMVGRFEAPPGRVSDHAASRSVAGIRTQTSVRDPDRCRAVAESPTSRVVAAAPRSGGHGYLVLAHLIGGDQNQDDRGCDYDPGRGAHGLPRVPGPALPALKPGQRRRYPRRAAPLKACALSPPGGQGVCTPGDVSPIRTARAPSARLYRSIVGNMEPAPDKT